MKRVTINFLISGSPDIRAIEPIVTRHLQAMQVELATKGHDATAAKVNIGQTR